MIQPYSAIPGPVSFPLIGTAWTYKTGVYRVHQYHEVLRALFHKYGPVVRERLAGTTIVHLFDPDDVKLVHQNEGKYPEVPPLQESALLYRQLKGMSLGLGNTNGEQWYRLRSAVQQMMMRPREVVHYLPLANRVASALTSRLQQLCPDQGVVIHQLERLIYKWALDSSCMVCTEREFGALSGGESETLADRMIDANRAIFRQSAKLKFAAVPLYRYISTPTWRRLVQSEDFFYSVAMKLFDRAICEIDRRISEDQISPSDFSFLSYMLSKDSMSRNDVLIITFSMFSDGLSTTVPAMLAALWCLSRAPQLQSELYTNICDVIGDDSDQCDVTSDVINKLPLLRAVLKETLRLYPIGTEVSRITGKDLILGGFHVPSGTYVDLNQSIHLLSDRWFPDPYSFLPQRWMTDARKNTHPYLHVPFGHGTRMCAGRRFAEQDIHTALAHILRRFRLEAGDNAAKLPQRYETLLVPDAPLNIRLVPRKGTKY